MKKQNKRGFTLIELLVVVLIIGILAAVAVPQYQKAVMRSRYATLKNITKSIADAQEVYYLANGEYTTRFDELDIDIGGTPKDENDTQRNFDWGACTIFDRGDGIICDQDDIKLRYQIFFRKAASGFRGEVWCVAKNQDDNSIQNKICQQEPGEANFHHKDPYGNTIWQY